MLFPLFSNHFKLTGGSHSPIALDQSDVLIFKSIINSTVSTLNHFKTIFNCYNLIMSLKNIKSLISKYIFENYQVGFAFLLFIYLLYLYISFICLCLYVINSYMCICVYAYVYICVCIYIYNYIYTYIYICVYINKYIYI